MGENMEAGTNAESDEKQEQMQNQIKKQEQK